MEPEKNNKQIKNRFQLKYAGIFINIKNFWTVAVFEQDIQNIITFCSKIQVASVNKDIL